MSAVEDRIGADLEDPAETLAPAPGGRSLVDRARARHAKRKRTIDLPIPEWEGDVIVRYGRMSKAAILAGGRRKVSPVDANAGLLAAACEEILILDDDGVAKPASDADGQPGAVGFDGRLADLFSLSAEVPAQIVRAMYADDVAVTAHAERVYNWQTGRELDGLSGEEVDEELGEAPAAT